MMSERPAEWGTGKIVREAPSFAMDAELWMHVVLVHPEIPQNSGNIARLAAATHAWLHLVEPLGYALEDRNLKRAGLDYWPNVRLSVHGSLESLESMLPRDRTWLFTRHASRGLGSTPLARGSVLVFGQESVGLPRAFVDRWSDRTVSIPTSRHVRSLNVANSVAIAGYHLLLGSGWAGEEPMEGR